MYYRRQIHYFPVILYYGDTYTCTYTNVRGLTLDAFISLAALGNYTKHAYGVHLGRLTILSTTFL